MKNKLIVLGCILTVVILSVACVNAYKVHRAKVLAQIKANAVTQDRQARDRENHENAVQNELRRLSAECQKAAGGVKLLPSVQQLKYTPDCTLRVI